MPWVKLDDQFPFNRKAIIAGKDGRALYVTALCWTSGQLTDGCIDDAAVPMLAAVSEVADAQATAAHLVATGLWERIPGGYEIHDYHDYNPSSGDVRAMREARAEAGRRGGLASAASKSQANGQANAEQKSTPSPSPSPSPIPVPSPSPVAAAAAHTSGVGKVLADHGILVNGPVQADMWRDLYDEAGTDLFTQALDEATRASPRVPTLKYIDAIIKRCMSDGTVPGDRRNRYSARASPMNDVDAAIEQYLREDGVTNGNGGDG